MKYFVLALRNLMGYPLRTLLTTLGVVFGVGSVISVMAMGAGAERELLREFGRLGIKNIILNSKEPPEKQKDEATNQWAFNRYGLTYKDERQIRATVPGVQDVVPALRREEFIWNGSRKQKATLYAVRPRYMNLFGLDVVRGRSLVAMDNIDVKRVCIIRAGILRELGVMDDPIGLPLLIGDHYYKIVGVLSDSEFLGYQAKALNVDSKTKEVYVPYETMFRRIGTRKIERQQGARKATDVQLSQIVVGVENDDDVLITARNLSRLLEKNHEDHDYEMVVPLEALAQKRKTRQVFNYALIAIASISLLVGGIGIANIMLATVTERTREIGVRRALGAHRIHIVIQFLMETTVISMLGGLVGVGAGFLFIYAMEQWTGWEFVVTSTSLGLALTISMVTGILFGIFPARRAAMLDPITALRHE